jgi:hypothetical protein
MSDPMEMARAWVARVFRMQPESDSQVSGLLACQARWIADEVAALITKAREEEREACAQCADRVALPRDKKNMLTGTDINAGMTIAASVIAQAIRSRGAS